MTIALRLRRRILLGAELSSVDEVDIPDVQEHERSYDAGYALVPIEQPLTFVSGGWDPVSTFFPLTAYSGGHRTRMPTPGLEDANLSVHTAMPTLVTLIESETTAIDGREPMPDLVTTIDSTPSTGA